MKYRLKNTDLDTDAMNFNRYLPIPILRPISSFTVKNSNVLLVDFEGKFFVLEKLTGALFIFYVLLFLCMFFVLAFVTKFELNH